MEDQDAAGEVADDIATFVNGGDTLEGAVRRLSRYVPADILADARLAYERRVGRIRDLDDPRVLVDASLRQGHWYPGPRSDDVYWPALHRELIEDGLGEAIGAVDKSSSRVLGLMRPPGEPEIHSRGLALGYVQSGKTTNFMSVIAKAADVGYRLFIVLSGITDNLRSQTQERLEDKLVGRLTERWFLLTGRDQDFLSPGNAPNLLSRTDHRLLAIIKKNPYRLRRLVRWLDSAGHTVLEACPILLIDDEADQASIDVGTHGRTSRINGLIRQILSKPKAAYLAYTATPFANLLIDPGNYEDIYPRDFIVELSKPDDYFGPEKIFGREPLTPEDDESATDGLDVIRHVGPDEIQAVQPPRSRAELDGWHPQITRSLSEALNWFVLATAARRHRATGVRHSTMLIHTSMLAGAHNRMRMPVEAYLQELEAGWRAGDQDTVGHLRNQWEAEIVRVPATAMGLAPVRWEDVSAHVGDVSRGLRVIVDNYLSSERLGYDRAGPDVVAVVIGGNTLSRGLTLEGLVCSFFVRAASAYDTLLQMGRWFGYRSGYGDLTRMWMTEELESWFFALATVEEEVRREIRRYEEEQLRPSDVPVRIRCHPAMAVTSAAKMRAAVPAKISFSQAREQTILFNHRNTVWLRHNLDATRRLIAAVRADGISLERTSDRRPPIFRDVPSERIRDFIADYQFHERAYRMRTDLLAGYLDEQNQQGYLRRWNVVVMAHPNTDNGSIDLGIGEPVGLIERSRLSMPNIPHANIKSLVSTVDRVADLDIPRTQLRDIMGSKPDDKRLAAYRDDIVGDVGLLCLYPISKDSQPRAANRLNPQRPDARPRIPMDATEHVIGVGLFFPEARGDVKEYTYLAADLSRIDRESDDVDIAEIDAADELAGEAESVQASSSGRVEQRP